MRSLVPLSTDAAPHCEYRKTHFMHRNDRPNRLAPGFLPFSERRTMLALICDLVHLKRKGYDLTSQVETCVVYDY